MRFSVWTAISVEPVKTAVQLVHVRHEGASVARISIIIIVLLSSADAAKEPRAGPVLGGHQVWQACEPLLVLGYHPLASGWSEAIGLSMSRRERLLCILGVPCPVLPYLPCQFLQMARYVKNLRRQQVAL
jgi:hypothetical protein